MREESLYWREGERRKEDRFVRVENLFEVGEIKLVHEKGDKERESESESIF